MRYYLSERVILRQLEFPAIYDAKNDELYELDEKAFIFLNECSSPSGCDLQDDNEFINYCISEGLLQMTPLNIKRAIIAKSPVPSLRYLELQITNRCNLSCRHCYIGKPEGKELSIEEIKIILDEFDKMQGLRLLVTGGEPLMHSQFGAINELLSEYLYRKILFTNGLLLNKDIIRLLNFDEVQFSVDGMEHGHDALRGKGTYRIVMRKIREFKDAGIAVSISTMIHKENLNEFEEMDALFKNMGIKDWTVDVPCLSGNMKENTALYVSPDIAGKYLKYGFGGGLHGGGDGFACGLHLASVTSSGDVCKCAFYSDTPAGNVRDGLIKSWKRIRHTKLKELDCFKDSCSVIDICRGGCRFRAEINGGNLKKDLYKCFEYDIMNYKDRT